MVWLAGMPAFGCNEVRLYSYHYREQCLVCVFDLTVANPFVRHRRARRHEKIVFGTMLNAVSICRQTYTTPTKVSTKLLGSRNSQDAPYTTYGNKSKSKTLRMVWLVSDSWFIGFIEFVDGIITIDDNHARLC